MNAPAFSQSGQAFRSSNGSQLSYQPLSDIREVSMRIIVGIDIGLTCTGVAIATYFDAPNGRHIDMRVLERWPGTDRTEKKVPTRVAYTAGELGIHSWGFGCPELRDLGGGMAIKDMFKFFLDPSYVEKFGPAPHKIPKRENVRLWYKDFLTALYAHIIKDLRDVPRIDLSSKSTSIEFVFSIPTRWNDDNVREFRDIAEDAGFGDTGNVIMELTEGEAAAVFTSKRLAHRFQRGEVFMVCDAGGGTTDMCLLHVKGAQDDIVELENLDDPKALLAGSVNIDDKFEARAKELLRFTTGVPQDKIADLALQITRGDGFQDIKRQFGTEYAAPIKVAMLQVPGLAERIAFPLGELKAMFDSQVDIMIEAIDKQISLLQSSKPYVRVSYLFLAGGLGSSKYVQDRLVEHYKSIAMQVLFAPNPDDLPLAVCKGLVIDRVQNLCQDGPVIPIRRSKSSYGILYKDLYGEKHSGQPPTTNQLDGQRYAENQIDWLVVKGSHYQRGQLVPRFYSILADPNMAEQSWGFSVVHSTSDARTLPTFLDNRGDVKVVCHVTSRPQARLHECGIAQKRGLIARRTMFSRVNYKLSAEIGVGTFEFKSMIAGQMEAKSQTLKVQWSAENRGGCDLIRRM
ncbi:uncharacterized protein PAC_18236 [Phialocephala subalpina]|uniref:Hsp70 protein n=1 Tax=Phialocephala subalpina TaxID=576137 RepID=A0A1L7XTN6_9HELO|nr:uncharacterized protein PAC_18236 [Phialocephala subalpina]